MTEPGFIPRTSILGICGTSYGLQLGEINNFLCIVVYRGKEVINFKKFDNITLNSIEDANYIVGWVNRNLLFFTNVMQISKTVRILIDQINSSTQCSA
ncbi:MAG: hypothetical protein EU531_07840 [Promethearchaeota archaeon]|nr:MAG: hypothetical protein EU531_07840 [Candidatus Lokiarchaeota archaeon]